MVKHLMIVMLCIYVVPFVGAVIIVAIDTLMMWCCAAG